MDYQILIRDYEKVLSLIKDNNDPYSKTVQFKCSSLLQLSEDKPLLSDQILNDQIFSQNYEVENNQVMDIELIKYQLLNFMKDDNEIAKQVFEKELTYKTFQPYIIELYKLPQEDLTRKVGWLEVIYKLIQSPKQKQSLKFLLLQELQFWQKSFVQIVREVKQNDEYFPILRKPLKELFRLSLIQILSIIEQKTDYFPQLLNIINNELASIFLDSPTVIAIIYSIARIVLPKVDSNEQLPNQIKDILKILKVHDKINETPNFNSWLQLFEYLMFLMLHEINLKKERIFQKKLEDKIKKQQPDLPFIDQLWYYVAVNFTQQNIKLNQALKKLVSHNVFALINIYCLKYHKYSFMNQVLEDLLITPFEDDILRMNMCIILFITDDFNKLHQIIQSLLASEQIKEHEFRPVIVSMCVMFTGLYLGKGEEALCFARMNFNDYNQGIITQDTLLAQIGYCYYNLGKQSKYVVEKQHFYAKALEYYEKSIEQNSENHLVQYNYGKLLAITGDIKKAFLHVDQACKLCGAEINFKILRALLYQTQHENSTALQIISSLIIIKQSPLLYYIKASILTEIYLLNQLSDKELQCAQQISEQLKDYVIKKNLKSKEVSSIQQNLKKFLLGIAKSGYEFDQNEQFISQLPPLKTMQSVDVDPLTYINYRNAIFNTTDILIKLQLFELSVLTLNLINDGNESNENEKLYYQGLLEEKMNNLEISCQHYEEVLRTDFYHVKAMTRLGLLYLKHYKDTKLQRATELLIAASKFDKTHEICLGLGILSHFQNNQIEAQKFFNEALRILKTSPIVSFQMIPDIFSTQ